MRRGWKGRNEIAIRLATLMRLSAQRRWLPPVDVLARLLEVHPRTIRRDLDALEAAQVVDRVERPGRGGAVPVVGLYRHALAGPDKSGAN